MYEALPKNERSFDIDVSGDDTGVEYKGQFKVKCMLDISGKHRLELEKTRLMADYANPSGGLRAIATALANIRSKVIQGPAWWSNSEGGATIMDENVILEIYDKCNEVETQWREELKKKAEDAQETNAQQSQTES